MFTFFLLVCFLAAFLLCDRRDAALFLPRSLRLDVHRGHPSVPNSGWRHLQQRLSASQLLHLWLRKPGGGGGNLSNTGLKVLRY